MYATECEARLTDTPGPGAGPRDRLLPLVPHLRAFARDLGNDDPVAADELVRDALVWALTTWHRLGPDDDLTARLAAVLRERAGSVRPTGP
jgi:DNA-directed RNA polymerase specialized sigma24 family protein